MEPNSSLPAATINAYFDLMYSSDDASFPEVFHEVCVVHGQRDGKLVAWSASEFRDLMRNRASPASTGAPRHQETIRLDQNAPDMATAKVRVRIGQICFLDELILHRIDARWLITSKAFHIEKVVPIGS